MKQYKHIPTGKTYKQNTSDGNLYDSETCLPKFLLNGKDWKEVKEERDYEDDCDNCGKTYDLRKGCDCKKKPDWTAISYRSKFDGKIWPVCIPNGADPSSNFEIFSVRRESDGEVFTIGDSFHCDENEEGGAFDAKIHAFVLEDGEIAIRYAPAQTHCMPYLSFIKKVKPKEWEITAFTRQVLSYQDVVVLHNGKYVSGDDFKELDYNFLLKTATIYKVKRLSDGVEFKVGDTLSLRIGKERITSFEINGDIMNVVCGAWHCSICNSDVKKLEKLFTTEDGVDIYKEDIFYYLHPSYANDPLLTNASDNIDYNNNSYYIHKFSTKEAAEEYILKNKPCLSLKEMHDFMGENYLEGLSTQLNKLAHYVKNKLKS